MTNGRKLTCYDCTHYNPKNEDCDLEHKIKALFYPSDGGCVDFSQHPEKSYFSHVCCEVCGGIYRPEKSQHYIARGKDTAGVFDKLTKGEVSIYDAYDCPHCGAQMIAQERKRIYDEADCVSKDEDDADDADDEVNTALEGPQPGEHIQFCGQEWVALGIEQGGLLVIKAEPLPEKTPFDKDGVTDWRKSSLRKYLNGEYLDSLGDTGDALLEFESDLTADDGRKDYGTCKDKVFLLSDALYRKYRENIPAYDTWWWTITPYSPFSDGSERFVNPFGSLEKFYRASYSLRAVPSLCLNLSSLR